MLRTSNLCLTLPDCRIGGGLNWRRRQHQPSYGPVANLDDRCLTCRRRKTRCAGERPLCSTCTRNGHLCLGYPEDKKDAGESKHEEVDEQPESQDDAEEQENKAKRTKASFAPPHLVDNNHGASPTSNIQFTSPSTDTVSNDRPSASPALSNVPIPVSPLAGQPGSIPTHSSLPSVTSHPEDLESPTTRRNQRSNNHRVPYFRYFGPTAIVPGFKRMVVSVRDRRRSTTGSVAGGSPLSQPSGMTSGSVITESDIVVEPPPAYDLNDPSPVHPLIISLAETFFTHLGCNYPFLKEEKFMAKLKDKRVEPILVDAICSLAARFSDSPILTGGNDKMPRTERGQVFAQRAKQATVDTFPCPTVGAVQACLLMAYEGFGANQDSALWMYLGLAIRMAVDLGLQKRVGIQYQGEQDPWNAQQRQTPGSESPLDKRSQHDIATEEEQKECEQERIDTFWAVFVLDRVISSGTGRPVTLRDDDFELTFPEPVLNPTLQWPTPFPILLQIIHLYGRVCDLLNHIQNVSDLNGDKWKKLMEFENRLTRVYKNWDSRLQFNVINFKAYLSVGQGPTFILLHFWFHALFIILHQPTLMTPFADMRSDFQLLPDSRELSMSSAKTICDILSFADLIDPKSFVGNPFTSQPMYIAACAFLMESSATVSRESSPPPKPQYPAPTASTTASTSKKSRHSLLASAANQNYQRCYSSLEHLHTYWGGVKYILTALDQKAKGIWDCETFTSEEYESTKTGGEGGMSAQLKLNDYAATSPSMAGAPPIAWSLAGTTNSPNSSMTLMYQNQNWNSGVEATASHPTGFRGSHSGTPAEGRAVSDARQAMRDNTGMLPPSFSHQPQASSMRGSPRHRLPNAPATSARTRPAMKLGDLPENSVDNSTLFMPPNYTPSSQHSNAFETYTPSPQNNMANHTGGNHNVSTGDLNNNFYLSQDMPYQNGWGLNLEMDGITFNSQDIDIGSLGLQQPQMMGQWLDYIPQDVLGLFDQQELDESGHGVP